jgi:predicted ABC-type ATPase
MEAPTLGIVAGPNGSGKSSFYEAYLRRQFPVWVNADEIAKTLTNVPERGRDLAAAELAEKRRNQLLAERSTFCFETVFSRTAHWLAFLRQARESNYRILLFFICTGDPDLCAARVNTRIGRGGHAVDLDKVIARYPGSIRTAVEAMKFVEELWLFDNTEWDYTPHLVGWWEDQQVRYAANAIPRWAQAFFP